MGGNKAIKSKNTLNPELVSLELFASFYPKFFLFELSLKNRLYALLSKELGSDWFTRQLSNPDNNVFAQEKELILRRKRARFSLSAKGLLVESGLGLWVEFFNRPLYKLAKGLPIQIFTQLPSEVKRKDIYKKMERIKELRNSLFHSRIVPITSSPQLAQLEEIMAIADDLKDILHWLGDLTPALIDFTTLAQQRQMLVEAIRKSEGR